MNPDENPSDVNPFASPQAVQEAPGILTQSQEELVRAEYLQREASIRSIGVVCYIGAAFFGSIGFSTLWMAAVGEVGALLLSLAIAIGYLGMAALHGWIGHGLRGLQGRVRIPAIIISVLWMLYVGLGTILGILAVIWLAGEKGKYVLSEEYRQIVAATPHMKYRTSKTSWILLVIVVMALISAIVFAIVGLP